jgi:methionyl-tRNA formyltransferase
MRIIFMGTPDFAVAALARLHAVHDIVAVYTRPPRPAGRGQKARPSPVQVFAEKHRLEVRAPKSFKAPDVQAEFASWGADVGVVAAYGLILSQSILDAPRFGCVNVHASLLPRWRGAAPIQRAIIAGDDITGVTIIQMDAGLDTGAMLLKREVSIDATTTAGGLYDILADVGSGLVLDVLAGLEDGSLNATPQPVEGVTHAAKIEKTETHIDFSHPAPEVLRQIHGLSPLPGAWFAYKDERVKVLKAEGHDTHGPAGTIVDDHLTIACARGSIRALSVQRAGKAPAEATAFLRGYALPKGTRVV